MKKSIFIFFLFFASYSFACSCIPRSVSEKFSKSVFVAQGTIVKNYKNVKGSYVYKADISISKLFKGKSIKSIYVYGNNGGKFITSCDIFIPEGQELIFYAHKDNKGRYVIGMCSGLLYFNKKKSPYKISKDERELELISFFKNLNNKDFNKAKLYSMDLRKNLIKLRGKKVVRNFGVFKISFDKDLVVKSVKSLSPFDKKNINQELMEILKNSNWSVLRNKDDILQGGYDYIIEIYYYKGNQKHPGFFTTHN